jgi:hypothetical protein
MSNNAKVVMLMGMLSLISNYSTGSGKKAPPSLSTFSLGSTNFMANQQCYGVLTSPGVSEQIERQLKANPGIKVINVLLSDNKVARIMIKRKIKDAFLVDLVHASEINPPSPRFELIYNGRSLGNRPLIHPVLFRAITEMASNPFPEVAAFPQVFPQLAFPQLIAFLTPQTESMMLADVLLSSVFQADFPLLQEALQVFAVMNGIGGILRDPVFLPILAQTLMSVLVHSGEGALPILLSTPGTDVLQFSPIPHCFPMQILLQSLYSPSIIPLALCFPEALAMAVTGSELFRPGLPLAAVLMPLLVKQFPAFAPTMEISQLPSILGPVVGFLYRLRNQEREAAIALVRAFVEVLLSPDTEELVASHLYPQALALELVARVLFQAVCPPSEYQSVLDKLLRDAGMDNSASAQLVMFAIQQLNAMMCNPDYSKLTGGHPLTGPLQGCYAVGISGSGRIIYAIGHQRQVVLVGIAPTHDYSRLESTAKAILDLLRK